MDCKFDDYVLEIEHVRLPCDVSLDFSRIGTRASTAALIIEDEVPRCARAEAQHLRQEIVVMRTWTAVQEQALLASVGPVRAPIQRHVRRRGEASGPGWSNRGHLET